MKMHQIGRHRSWFQFFMAIFFLITSYVAFKAGHHWMISLGLILLSLDAGYRGAIGIPIHFSAFTGFGKVFIVKIPEENTQIYVRADTEEEVDLFMEQKLPGLEYDKFFDEILVMSLNEVVTTEDLT